MRKTTRVKILDTIYRRQLITAEELANSFGFTIASVRHHLKILMTESLVEIVSHTKNSLGRPTNIYGISDLILDQGRRQLLLGALEELFDNPKDENNKNRLRKLSARFVEKLERDDSNLESKKLSSFVDQIRRFHYSPRWQASPSGAQILFERCPYKSVIQKFPQLCSYDKYIIEEYFAKRVDLLEKIIPIDRDSNRCLFQLYE